MICNYYVLPVYTMYILLHVVPNIIHVIHIIEQIFAVAAGLPGHHMFL